MALNKEIWTEDIIGNLFKNNQFAQRAINRDGDVLNGTVVHTAVAGVAADVKKNLTVFPQTATVRSDADNTYALDALYSLPRRIPNLDKYELSYDKRQSVVGEDTTNLIQQAMDNLLWRWAPSQATQIIETTGTASSDDLIDSTATGTRKAFTKAELKKAAKQLDKKEFSGFNKVAVLTAAHYHQLFESLSDAEKTNFNNVADLENGVIGRYMGIDIMMRSTVLRYREVSDVWTPIDELDDNFAAGATDCEASLIFAENAVERALGTVDVFDNPGQALYYGDVFSAMMYFGGRQRRPEGIIAVVSGPNS